MPAPDGGFGRSRRSERLAARAGVLIVQLGLALALLAGFRVEVSRPAEMVGRLIEVVLPPKRPPPPIEAEPRPRHEASAPPKTATPSPGAAPRPKREAAPSVAPVVVVPARAAPSGGGTGLGSAAGAASGGGAGGEGVSPGDNGGGTDLEQIAGEIRPSDYPRDLRDAGVGGTVGLLFTVGTNGRVARCTVTRSSGVPELDALTCRLIQKRFRYRPATDRFGRPVADEVEGDHEWVARAR
jgi:protein TonB